MRIKTQFSEELLNDLTFDLERYFAAIVGQTLKELADQLDASIMGPSLNPFPLTKEEEDRILYGDGWE